MFEKYLFHAVEYGFITAFREIIRRNNIDLDAQIAGDPDCKEAAQEKLRSLYGRATVCAAFYNQLNVCKF